MGKQKTAFYKPGAKSVLFGINSTTFFPWLYWFSYILELLIIPYFYKTYLAYLLYYLKIFSE